MKLIRLKKLLREAKIICEADDYNKKKAVQHNNDVRKDSMAAAAKYEPSVQKSVNSDLEGRKSQSYKITNSNSAKRLGDIYAKSLYSAYETVIDGILGEYITQLDNDSTVKTFLKNVENAINQSLGNVMQSVYVDVKTKSDQSPEAGLAEIEKYKEAIDQIFNTIVKNNQTSYKSSGKYSKIFPKELFVFVQNTTKDLVASIEKAIQQKKESESSAENVQENEIKIPDSTVIDVLQGFIIKYRDIMFKFMGSWLKRDVIES